MPSQEPETIRDLIEERAAIMEYDGGHTRHIAQNLAAKMHGFANWAEYEKTKERKDK